MANLFSYARMAPPENRKTAFAGTWYEADSDKLKAQLSEFVKTADEKMQKQPFELSFADNGPVQGQILAAITPHAGYMFSGATAAFAYDASNQQSKKANKKIKRVFVLGPSHYIGFHGMALPSEKNFRNSSGFSKIRHRNNFQTQRFSLVPSFTRRAQT